MAAAGARLYSPQDGSEFLRIHDQLIARYRKPRVDDVARLIDNKRGTYDSIILCNRAHPTHPGGATASSSTSSSIRTFARFGLVLQDEITVRIRKW